MTEPKLYRLKRPVEYFDENAKPCSALEEVKSSQKKDAARLINPTALREALNWSYLGGQIVGAEEPPRE